MSNFTNIEAVLFDMDGTLIEHTWQLSQITDTLFAKFSNELAPLTSQEFFDVFWPKNADMWYMMVDGVLSGDEAQVYSYTNTLRALNKDTSLAQPMVDYWTALVLEEVIPFKDATQVLKTIKAHFTTGIVTNGFITLQRAKIQHHQLDSEVDFCLISEEAGYHKPDVRIFQQALALAGNIPPERAVFVGDTLTSDIAGACQAGIHPVFINPHDDQTPPAGVPKIKSLSDLLTLLPISV